MNTLSYHDLYAEAERLKAENDELREQVAELKRQLDMQDDRGLGEMLGMNYCEVCGR